MRVLCDNLLCLAASTFAQLVFVAAARRLRREAQQRAVQPVLDASDGDLLLEDLLDEEVAGMMAAAAAAAITPTEAPAGQQ